MEGGRERVRGRRGNEVKGREGGMESKEGRKMKGKV